MDSALALALRSSREGSRPSGPHPHRFDPMLHLHRTSALRYLPAALLGLPLGSIATAQDFDDSLPLAGLPQVAGAWDSLRNATDRNTGDIIIAGPDTTDTLAWDGCGWTRYVGTPIGTDDLPAFATDPVTGEVISLGLLDTGSGSISFGVRRFNGSWVNVFSGSPENRVGHAAHYFPPSNRTIVYGGSGAWGILDSQLSWDGAALFGPAIPPTTGSPLPPLFEPAMSYDSSTDQLVMHGGLSDHGVVTGSTYLYDTIGANTFGWIVQTGIPGPALFRHSISFDETRNVHVLTGGFDANGAPNLEVFELNLSDPTPTWRNTSVIPFAGSTSAIDSGSGHLILAGEDPTTQALRVDLARLQTSTASTPMRTVIAGCAASGNPNGFELVSPGNCAVLGSVIDVGLDASDASSLFALSFSVGLLASPPACGFALDGSAQNLGATTADQPIALTLPAAPALAGTTLFFQGAVLDTTGTVTFTSVGEHGPRVLAPTGCEAREREGSLRLTFSAPLLDEHAMQHTLRLALVLLLPTPAIAQEAAPTRPPNVVLMLADDLAWDDLGCYDGTRIRTPRLDALAEEGVRLTDYHAGASVCSPSRMALMSGSYPARLGWRWGVVGWGFEDGTGMSPDVHTMAEAFRGAGYRTAMSGKWHLGPGPMAPENQGFDSALYILRSNNQGRDLYRDGELVEKASDNRLLTERFAAEALRVVREESDEPFFLYLPWSAPHFPAEAHPDWEGRSKKDAYTDVVEELDHRVGEILDALDEAGARDETIVVFTSDNGRQAGQQNPAGGPPWSGIKWHSREGGTRVPCIVRWPGRVTSRSTSDALVSALDLYPTLASACGVALPEGAQRIDGVDVLDALVGGDAAPREELLYWHGKGQATALRQGRWKLFFHAGEKGDPDVSEGPVLFDLEADPGEERDLAEQEPVRVAALMERARLLLEDVYGHQTPLGAARVGVDLPEPLAARDVWGPWLGRD